MAEKREDDSRRIYRFSRALRKYRWLLPIFTISTTLAATTFLVSGCIVAGISLYSLSAVARGISSYVSTNALLTATQRLYATKLKRNKEKRIAACLIFDHEKALNKALDALNEGIGDNTVENMVEYAENYRKSKFAKHIFSALVGISLAYAGLAKATCYVDSLSSKIASISTLKEQPITAIKEGANAITDDSIFIAKKGEGIWHISRRALEYHYGEAFKALTEKEKIRLIDRRKDKII
ncbi:MAG: hypothetical protein QXS91_03450 [Candidatus Anstonellales archaeon]